MLAILSFSAKGQSDIDSLWRLYNASNSDTVKIRLRFEIANESYDMSIPLWDSIISASKKYPKLSPITAQAYNNRGFIYDINGESTKAVASYDSSMQISIEHNDILGECLALHNISACYQQIGEYEKALSYSFRCLKIAEKNQFNDYVAAAYNTHAVCYHYMGLPNLAIDYYNRAIDGHMKAGKGSEYEVAVCYTNIGSVFYDLDQVDEAMEYYKKSLELTKNMNHFEALDQRLINKNNIGMILASQEKNEEAKKIFFRNIEVYDSINDKHGVGISYSNLAGIYSNEKNYTKALDYARKSVANLNTNFPFEIAETYSILSKVYQKLGATDSAFFYADRAQEIAEKINSNDLKSRTNETLYRIYKDLGKFDKALDHFEMMRKAELSILNDKSKNKVLEQKYRIGYLEQAIADSLKNQQRIERDSLALMASNAQKQKLKAEKDKLSLAARYDKIRLYGILLIALILFIFAFFIYKRFKVEREQKRKVETQKNTIESQHVQLETVHKEISDSIKYAKHLQMAILPTEEQVKKAFKDSFIMFKPKDVVSGDFYWMHEDQDQVLFAVADCTGHGVPGAMVSIVCSEALNRSVLELSAKSPNEVLDQTKKIVSATFAKAGKMVRDGMDISMIRIDKARNELQYAGANNPIYLLSSDNTKGSYKSILNNDRHHLFEIKPDKQSIGFSTLNNSFQLHTVPMKDSDIVYLFSDGYADQFGGTAIAGKKLKSKNFKKILLDNAHLSMEEQSSKIEQDFLAWKGTFEQLDDVCVAGIKL